MNASTPLVLAALLAGSTAHADIINVGPGDSIQDAIDAATNGDEIIVAPGTYSEAIDFLGKAITVRSTDPKDPDVVAATIIDGTGNFHVVRCVSGEGPDTVLDGFTVTGGNANGLGGPPNYDGAGGGMSNIGTSPTVNNCIFTGNEADGGGGGMANLDGASPAITACSFVGNMVASAGGNGGGMLNFLSSSPTVIDSMFSGNGNAAASGGGMLNESDSDPTVTNCTFSDNTSSAGGAMVNTDNSDPMVTNCTFSDNSSIIGGGMHNGSNSNPTVRNCAFSKNAAANRGGGMFNILSSNPVVINCMFAENSAGTDGGGMLNQGSEPTVINSAFIGNSANSGGGMHNECCISPTVANCTFIGNIGHAMTNNVASSSPMVINCILWANNPDEISGGTPAVSYSNVQGGFPGIGNMDADPLFVDPDGPDDDPNTWADNDYRLSAGSPCIDRGDNTAVPPGTDTDLDGNPRPADDTCKPDTGNPPGDAPYVDMGAYEFQCTSCDVVFDGTVGVNDFLQVLADWGPCADCGYCPSDFDGDCEVGVTDFLLLLASWGSCP